jgi:hypothetical protein
LKEKWTKQNEKENSLAFKEKCMILVNLNVKQNEKPSAPLKKSG